MMRSLYSGVSGLKGHQTRMDVIGNNIANVNTTGFKSSRVTFADTLLQTQAGAAAPSGNLGGTNPKQIGLGVGVASIDTIFTDGSVQATGKNTDLCLSGNGLFVVKKGSETFYTRDGAFEFDAEGNYVLPGSGLKVQGWMSQDGVLNTTGAVGDISISAGKSMESKATSIATYTNNLNAATAGYEISSILVTKTDGTTETVSSYNPQSYTGDLWLNCPDGKFLVPINPAYNVGSTATFSICCRDSAIDSITANGTGQVTLDVNTPGQYVAINDNRTSGSVTIPSSAISSGTYSIGGTYNVNKTISGVEHLANDNNNIKLTFSDNSDGISSVVVPDPYGKFAVGDSFSLSLKVTGGKATTGATVKDSETGNVVTISAAYGDVDAELGKDYTITRTPEAITNAPGVKSVTINTADGTSLAGLVNSKYSSGGTFYPSVTTTVTVYDSLGSSHNVPVLFTKTGDNEWALSLKGGSDSCTITESDGTTTTVNLSSKDLKFSSDGKYISGSGNLTLNYTNGAAESKVALNLAAITQFAGNSTINASADGHAAGTLSSVSVDSSGIITGTYTNGVKQAEAQVAIAQFTNAAGLTKTGTSLYQESNNSGTANVKTATDLGVTITPSALEMSNVDIANEFSDMIVTQRGFQSNSKIITVSDEMLETMINMKR